MFGVTTVRQRCIAVALNMGVGAAVAGTTLVAGANNNPPVACSSTSAPYCTASPSYPPGTSQTVVMPNSDQLVVSLQLAGTWVPGSEGDVAFSRPSNNNCGAPFLASGALDTDCSDLLRLVNRNGKGEVWLVSEGRTGPGTALKGKQAVPPPSAQAGQPAVHSKLANVHPNNTLITERLAKTTQGVTYCVRISLSSDLSQSSYSSLTLQRCGQAVPLLPAWAAGLLGGALAAVAGRAARGRAKR